MLLLDLLQQQLSSHGCFYPHYHSFLVPFSNNLHPKCSSEKDSEYEPFLRSLNTSDDTASSSDNDYFLTSENEKEGCEEA